MKHRRLILTTAAASIAFAAACDSSSPSPAEPEPQTGSVTAAVHDSLAVLPAGRMTPSPEDSTLYTGTMDGSVEVELYSSTNEWVSLGDPQMVEFAIYCREAALPYQNASVPVDTYSRVRLTLDGFVAAVNAGAVIQAMVYDSAFTVDLADGGVITIEKDVTPFSVTAGSSTKVLFDLNSEVWLDAEVVASATVPATEVGAATVAYFDGGGAGVSAAAGARRSCVAGS